VSAHASAPVIGSASADEAVAPARIGPNAITRVAEALTARFGADCAAQVFAAARLQQHLVTPPAEMVDERDVMALHAALRGRLGAADARAIARDAGLRTADYLLGHRIPRPVQGLLKLLPAPWASHLLLRAIGGHAWTFAGSGRFSSRGGRPTTFAIAGCPLCRPAAPAASPALAAAADGSAARRPADPSASCAYYAATFERLYRVLVARRAVVTETACEAHGAPACCFVIRW